MSRKTVYIEVWEHIDEKHWMATAQGDISWTQDTSQFELRYFAQDQWRSWYRIEGREYIAVVVSAQAFTRNECVEIARRIITGEGLKRWEVKLT